MPSAPSSSPCRSTSLTLAASQGLLWLVVRAGHDPGYWALAVPLFVGGLGLGLAAPILVSVVLAGVPGRDGGAAGGVLSTVNQLGGAAGVAVLGTVFFAALDRGTATAPLQAYGDAFAAVLPLGMVLYLLAAAAMLALPRTAGGPPQLAPPVESGATA